MGIHTIFSLNRRVEKPATVINHTNDSLSRSITQAACDNRDAAKRLEDTVKQWLDTRLHISQGT